MITITNKSLYCLIKNSEKNYWLSMVVNVTMLSNSNWIGLSSLLYNANPLVFVKRVFFSSKLDLVLS